MARPVLASILTLALIFAPASGRAQSTHRAIIERVEWEVSDTGARVIVVVKGKVDYSTHTAGAAPESGLPARAYVDLKPAQLGSAITREPIPVNDRLVRRIRIGQFNEDTTRIVVDLAEPALFHVTTADRPARLILKLVPPRGGAGAKPAPQPPPRAAAPTRAPRATPRNRTPEPSPSPSPRPTPPPTPVPAARPTPSPRPSPSPSPTVSAPKYTIVIDPGHGGKDPGARGITGDQEKGVTLAIAKLVAQRLESDPHTNVVLTRSTDDTVSLGQRTAIANAQGADLFVSIHANASESASAVGIETYTLNNSDDQATIRLAALENGLAATGAARDESDLAYILSDLLQTGKEDESIALAEAVQGGLVSYLGGRWRSVADLGVKRGPFYVLVGAYMPCVLVEVGFLTHPTEGQRVASKKYQRDLAEGITRGIRQFLSSADASANL
ncbi:MAG: N-acetylmuramoyl-L-alanine amidase [Candidatus Binatia bacterium]|nr:N-acetylmuramoyl-L-alanine amidase [Candidatus Binatia bacterium]